MQAASGQGSEGHATASVGQSTQNKAILVKSVPVKTSQNKPKQLKTSQGHSG